MRGRMFKRGMSNSKLKRKNYEKTIRLNILEKARDEDYCRIWLALLDSGISRTRLLRIYDEFHEIAVEKYQRYAVDGVLQHKLKEFLQEVQLERETVERVVLRHSKEISEAFPTPETYKAAIGENTTDLLVLLSYIHSELGYGHIRLYRLIDYAEKYQGDAREEVSEKLNVHYAKDDELAYSLTMLNVSKQRVKVDYERVQKEMEAVRMIQEQAK